MSKKFAEQMLDSMVDENGHCGERGLSHKQFGILSQYLCPEEVRAAGFWQGHYKTVEFTSQNYVGTIGKYAVVINEYWHFKPRHTVVSIDLRPQDEIDRENELEELRKFDHSEWVREPKQRFEATFTLVSDYVYYGQGYTYYDDCVRHIYTFADEEGNCIVWKTANPLGIWGDDNKWVEAEIGCKVTLKATVKEHSEYKGVKQTVVTRAKLLAVC